MTKGNLIHIKLEYAEAIQAKRDILSTEINLLKISKTIKRYRSLRIDELNTKTKLHRKLKALNINIKKMQTILPKLKIPEILKENYKETYEIKQKLKPKKSEYHGDIESQLRDIQNQLHSLEK